MSLLIALNRFYRYFWCFQYRLWTSKHPLDKSFTFSRIFQGKFLYKCICISIKDSEYTHQNGGEGGAESVWSRSGGVTILTELVNSSDGEGVTHAVTCKGIFESRQGKFQEFQGGVSRILNEMLCAICFHLYNLKTVKNIYGWVLLLALDCTFTKSNTLPWVFFTIFKLYKWYQLAQCITHEILYSKFSLQLIIVQNKLFLP